MLSGCILGKCIKDAGEDEGGDISGWGFMHKINVINMELARTDTQMEENYLVIG